MVAVPSVNLLAVLVATIAAFLAGGVYWALFTNAWRQARGLTAEAGRMAPSALGVALVTRILIAYVLALFVRYAHAAGLLGGAEIGLLAWLGFVLPPALGEAAFGGRPWKSLPIGLPEPLIGLVLMGAVLGVWP
jgi:hypothetical protein